MLLQYTFATAQLPVVETYETMNYTENKVDCQMLGDSEIAKIKAQAPEENYNRVIMNIKQICLDDKEVMDFWAADAGGKQWRKK